DRDRKLKVTIPECSSCHTRVLPDGTTINGAQGNFKFGLPVDEIFFAQNDELRRRDGVLQSPEAASYSSYGVPWLNDDINLRFKTMSKEDRNRIDGTPKAPSTFARFNGSPYFINHMPDLIGVRDRKYLDSTATHRNRGPEDIARYAILVTDADDGAIGSYTFKSDKERTLHNRHSDDAMFALGKYPSSLTPPRNPSLRSELSARGEQVFTRSGCGSCHTPPLYTNNKLVPVDGFTPLAHPDSPPPGDLMIGARLGLDPGL